MIKGDKPQRPSFGSWDNRLYWKNIDGFNIEILNDASIISTSHFVVGDKIEAQMTSGKTAEFEITAIYSTSVHDLKFCTLRFYGYEGEEPYDWSLWHHVKQMFGRV